MSLKSVLHRKLVESGYSTEWYLIPMAAAVGALMGLVAVGFDLLVESSGYFFFGVLGRWRGESAAGRGVELLLLVALPALGGLAVGLLGLLTRRMPAGSRGPGIPVVVEALARHEGNIPARAGLLRAVTSSLTLGSGGSAGVEGPIILIGSSLASSLSRVMHIGREHRQTLVGCGAAAATAGIFNAPIAGVIFVLEVILRDFSLKTFMPIVVASVFGVATAQALLGQNEAVFEVSTALSVGSVFSFAEMGHYAVLGVLCGLLGAGFHVALRWSTRAGAALKAPGWLKPALGGASLGLLGVGFVLLFRQPVVNGYAPPTFFGNGYPVIEALLEPASYDPGAAGHGHLRNHGLALLAALLGLKLVGTCLTLGSGGSGGIIAPSLLLGATLGAGFAVACRGTGFFFGDTPAAYALAGMAGVIAAVAHCPLTAFLLVFEITADYEVILPIMLVAILATTVAQLVVSDSIYAAMLRDRGIRTGTHSDLTLLRRLRCRDVPLAPAVVVHPDDPAQRLIDLAADYAVVDYVVADDHGRCIGMVVGQDVRATLVRREAVPLMIVSELMRTNLPVVAPGQTLDVVMEQFSQHDVASLVVVDDDGATQGVITRSRLMQTYQGALDKRG